MGLPIWCVTRQECVDQLVARATHGQGAWVLTLNLEMVARQNRDASYRELAKQADIYLADGMPIVWASRKKKNSNPVPERVTGADITVDLIERLEPARIAIIGGISPRAALLKILGEQKAAEPYVFDGMVAAEEEQVASLAREIAPRDPQAIFIALGVPKQDRIALMLRKHFPKAILMGVGGTFEFITGEQKRAPLWMQKSGTEWLYRLLSNPKRLWRRYLVEYWGGGLALLRDIRKAG